SPSRLRRSLCCRTSARTSWPSPNNSLTKFAPTKPVAPVTRTFMKRSDFFSRLISRGSDILADRVGQIEEKRGRFAPRILEDARKVGTLAFRRRQRRLTREMSETLVIDR